MQGSRKELVDSLYLIALQGINQFLPLLVLPYLMVVLGATGYGYIGFSLSVVQYLVLVVDFGFNLSATRRIAQVRDNREELTRVFWSVFWAKLVLLAVPCCCWPCCCWPYRRFRNTGQPCFAPCRCW